jgi:hypothetical protein
VGGRPAARASTRWMPRPVVTWYKRAMPRPGRGPGAAREGRRQGVDRRHRPSRRPSLRQDNPAVTSSTRSHTRCRRRTRRATPLPSRKPDRGRCFPRSATKGLRHADSDDGPAYCRRCIPRRSTACNARQRRSTCVSSRKPTTTPRPTRACTSGVHDLCVRVAANVYI